MKYPRAVLIAGPTASGKSALALELARRLDGVILNADSMQVYAELRVLTARPTVEDEAAVPHRLYGHVPCADGYTVATYLRHFREAQRELGRHIPVIVGGTGLYFNALTQGLSDIPPVNDKVRAFWRERAADCRPGELHRELKAIDPAAFHRLDPHDLQRIIRALEVYDSTGKSLSEWQESRSAPLVDLAHAVRIVISPDRTWLHERIERRFRAMISDGGLDEAQAFGALGLDPALPAMKAIGVPELLAAARGQLSVDDAVDQAVVATRQYAKRQETWFRNQMPDWRRIDSSVAGNILAAVEEIAQQMK
ncbi:tRNA (adenosine(37)-N6)-dimethylallyltransferase MiaA [Oryzibacter oryziterrae]|uniref:tRNA (adenosine(37)-N6)-dimethylallyltransferase MiaA n=1 Tax=Oryzibacter oryziterrae TaxID=2766474 RepID=UPI001F017B93|nr:tRNA (adenosine(37)-N6)-dimethylallyltransferase MiaA [Oryzibacter oryziterrae]